MKKCYYLKILKDVKIPKLIAKKNELKKSLKTIDNIEDKL